MTGVFVLRLNSHSPDVDESLPYILSIDHMLLLRVTFFYVQQHGNIAKQMHNM